MLPLALGAVVAVLLLAETADDALWTASGERYAVEILNEVL